MADYENMSLEELDKLRHDLMLKRLLVAEEQDNVVAVINRKAAEAKAQEKYDAMSDAEKKALHQILKVPGIESKEKVGRP